MKRGGRRVWGGCFGDKIKAILNQRNKKIKDNEIGERGKGQLERKGGLASRLVVAVGNNSKKGEGAYYEK